MAERRVAAYSSPGRIKPGNTGPTAGRVLKGKPRMQAMAGIIRRAGRRSRYRLRTQAVEPVFGQIKQARGFRQSLHRGLDGCKGGSSGSVRRVSCCQVSAADAGSMIYLKRPAVEQRHLLNSAGGAKLSFFVRPH